MKHKPADTISGKLTTFFDDPTLYEFVRQQQEKTAAYMEMLTAMAAAKDDE